MEGVVADAQRIEKIHQEQPTPAADIALESMNRQIQILKKDLIKANEKLAAQTATPPQTASMALPATVAAAQPPPAAFAPPQRPQAMAPPPPLSTQRQFLCTNMCRITSLNIGRRILHILGARTGDRTDGR